MATLPQIESTVSGRLRSLKLTKTETTELARVAARLQQTGAAVRDVFPLGIMAPDTIRFKAELPPEKLQALLDLLRNLPRLRSIEIFPQGIIAPEVWRLHVTVNR